MELARAEAARRDDAAARQAEQEAAARAANMEDYRSMLLASGRQPRTVGEILAAGAAMPVLLPTASGPGGPVPAVAQRAEIMIGGVALERTGPPPRVGGEPVSLLARCEAEAAAWRSGRMLEIQAASRRAQEAEPPLVLPYRQRGPRRQRRDAVRQQDLFGDDGARCGRCGGPGRVLSTGEIWCSECQ